MQIRIQSGADIPCGRYLFESKQQENFFQVSLNIKVRQSCSCSHHNAVFGMGGGADVSLHLILTSALDKGERSASRTARFIPTGIMKGGWGAEPLCKFGEEEKFCHCLLWNHDSLILEPVS
jgi:hypothetical protein